jgi:hypothetical protein
VTAPVRVVVGPAEPIRLRGHLVSQAAEGLFSGVPDLWQLFPSGTRYALELVGKALPDRLLDGGVQRIGGPAAVLGEQPYVGHRHQFDDSPLGGRPPWSESGCSPPSVWRG